MARLSQDVVSRKEFIRGFTHWFKSEILNSSDESGDKYQDYLLLPGIETLNAFLDKCNQCYDCVEVCPNESIRVWHKNHSCLDGYPVIVPKIEPCHFCDNFPCIDVCSTGAVQKKNSHLPLGVVSINEQHCHAYQDHFCLTCVNSCPESGKAISTDHIGRPFIIKDKCTGCGVCINVCPAEKPAIRILHTGE